MKSIISLLLILALTAGCASTPPCDPITVVDTTYVYADCGTPPERTAVDLRPVTWTVIDGQFALSAEGYENLSYNTTMILAAIKEYKVELAWYEECLSEQARQAEMWRLE